jgi:hypothetical protein
MSQKIEIYIQELFRRIQTVHGETAVKNKITTDVKELRPEGTTGLRA